MTTTTASNACISGKEQKAQKVPQKEMMADNFVMYHNQH